MKNRITFRAFARLVSGVIFRIPRESRGCHGSPDKSRRCGWSFKSGVRVCLSMQKNESDGRIVQPCTRNHGGDRVGPAGPALCRPDVITHYARRVVMRSSFSIKGPRKIVRSDSPLPSLSLPAAAGTRSLTCARRCDGMIK